MRVDISRQQSSERHETGLRPQFYSVVHRNRDLLLDPKIVFRRLDGRVPEQALICSRFSLAFRLSNHSPYRINH